MSKIIRLETYLRKLVRETIEEKKTEVDKTWEEMIDVLSKDVQKVNDSISVYKNDAGHYVICGCEPHYFDLNPIVHNLFDCTYFRDNTQREKKLSIAFEDLKKYIKDKLTEKNLNYVDSAYEKNVENSKDKEGGKKGDKLGQESMVDPEKDNKPSKQIKAEPMNKEDDDPTQPMREVGKITKLVDYDSKKPSYKPPTLPKNLQKLVIKLKKNKQNKKSKKK